MNDHVHSHWVGLGDDAVTPQHVGFASGGQQLSSKTESQHAGAGAATFG
jgi:hypothetical protein